MSRHWLTTFDPANGEPHGQLCDCEIGANHYGNGLLTFAGPTDDDLVVDPAATTAAPAEVVRCAQVEIAGETVALTFTASMTPVESVAAFLRDLADEIGMEIVPAAHLLYGLADQLDPPVTAVVDDARPGGEP